MSTTDFSWGKGGRCFWLTTYHPCSVESREDPGLNQRGIPRATSACRGIPLPLRFTCTYKRPVVDYVLYWSVRCCDQCIGDCCFSFYPRTIYSDLIAVRSCPSSEGTVLWSADIRPEISSARLGFDSASVIISPGNVQSRFMTSGTCCWCKH